MAVFLFLTYINYTTALVRTRKPEKTQTVGKMIQSKFTRPFIVILRVNAPAFKEARKLFSQNVEKELSFTDCTSVTLMTLKDIESIASFDTDFDGTIPRTS